MDLRKGEIQMKTKKMVNKVYEILNRSKKLEIASILVDFESDHIVLIELMDGSRFEIIVIPTRLFV